MRFYVEIPLLYCSGIYFCFFSFCSMYFLRIRLMYCDRGRQSSSAFSRSFSNKSLSIVMLIASNSIKVIASSLTAVDNAAFLPRVIFGVLICLGILFLVMGGKQTAANRATAPEGGALEKKAHETLRSLGALLALFVYVFFLDRLGFVISSILYMVFMMMYMTKKDARRPILFVMVSVVMTVVVYFCFREFLYIYLPNGILEGVI